MEKVLTMSSRKDCQSRITYQWQVVVKVEQTHACQMPECIVTLHALWKRVRDGKVAVRDEAHGRDGGAGGR